MTLTFVIHVLPPSVARGNLAGRLEVVSTGQVIPWGSGDELLHHLDDAARRQSPNDSGPKRDTATKAARPR